MSAILANTRPQVNRKDLRRGAIYQYLMRSCLVLYLDTLRDIERFWGLDAADVDRLGVASPPTHTFNVIGAGECARKFGDLSDVDERLARRGVVLAVRDPFRVNLITDLKIWRHVRDPHPFLLRVRAERQPA